VNYSFIFLGERAIEEFPADDSVREINRRGQQESWWYSQPPCAGAYRTLKLGVGSENAIRDLGRPGRAEQVGAAKRRQQRGASRLLATPSHDVSRCAGHIVRVERAQVAGLERGHSIQPSLGKEVIPAGETVVEGAAGTPESRGDRRGGHGGRTSFERDLAS